MENDPADKTKAWIDLLRFLASALPQLKLSADDYNEMRAEIATLGAQTTSVRPKAVIIEECRKTFLRVLKNSGNPAQAADLIRKLESLVV